METIFEFLKLGVIYLIFAAIIVAIKYIAPTVREFINSKIKSIDNSLIRETIEDLIIEIENDVINGVKELTGPQKKEEVINSALILIEKKMNIKMEREEVTTMVESIFTKLDSENLVNRDKKEEKY